MATAKPKSKAVAHARKKQPPWLWIGVAGLVLVLAVAAIVSSGGGNDDEKQSAAGIEETRAVTVTGDALPAFDRRWRRRRRRQDHPRA